MALSALVLLCGCSKKILNHAGGKPLASTDTVALVAVEDTAAAVVEVQEVAPQRVQIPEEWTLVKDDSLVVLESMSGELDSLLNSWYANTYLMVDTTCTATSVNPLFSDTVYTERLANLPCIVPMVYNQPVRTHIDRYATKLRHQVSFMLGMMSYYEPLIEQALDVYDVPN